MGTTEYADRLQRYVDQINQQLDLGIPGETTPYADLLKAMRYSLLAGGKRIRPVLDDRSGEGVSRTGRCPCIARRGAVYIGRPDAFSCVLRNVCRECEP